MRAKSAFVCIVMLSTAAFIAATDLSDHGAGSQQKRVSLQWLRGRCAKCLWDDLGRFQFVSPTQGWAFSQFISPVGNGSGISTILHTTDGGNTWRQLALLDKDGTKGLLDFWFADPVHGWVYWRDNRGVDHFAGTDNGGVTWKALPDQGVLYYIRFFNSHDGVYVADGFGRTRDGGRHWAKIRLPLQSADAMWFRSLNTGWIAGIAANGAGERQLGVLRTADGGATWAWSPLVGFRDARADELAWIDDKTGWLVLRMEGDDTARLLETNDGGVSWHAYADRTFQEKAKRLTAILFVDNQVGYVFYDEANGRHFLLDTADGGKTFEQTPIAESVFYCQLVGAEVWCSAGLDILKIQRSGH